VASHKLEGLATQTPVSCHSVENKIEEEQYQWFQNQLEKQERRSDNQLGLQLELIEETRGRVFQCHMEQADRLIPFRGASKERYLQLRREEQEKHSARRMELYNTMVKQSRRDDALTVKSLHSLFTFSC